MVLCGLGMQQYAMPNAIIKKITFFLIRCMLHLFIIITFVIIIIVIIIIIIIIVVIIYFIIIDFVCKW